MVGVLSPEEKKTVSPHGLSPLKASFLLNAWVSIQCILFDLVPTERQEMRASQSLELPDANNSLEGVDVLLAIDFLLEKQGRSKVILESYQLTSDMGAAEQHQNIARREWDELRSSREWISVENHFARCDRKIDAIFEKARSMYHDGHLALDIEDESDIKRGLDAYFSDLHDFPSNGHRFRWLKLVAGNAIGSDRKEGEVGCPRAAWAMAGGEAPFDVGFFMGNENADPADMGTAEQHQNIARREWDELRLS
nr:hypothetical protein [Tanacetum cinerariifolium]